MALLDQLARELGMSAGELRERLVDDDGGSEALVPTYLTLNPDGTISATFSGHVVASGLDLSSGPAAATSKSQAVRWLRDTDGALSVYVAAIEDALGGRTLDLATVLSGFNDFTHQGSRLWLHSQGGDGTPSQVQVKAGTVDGSQSALRVLLDSLGASNFVQLDTSRALKVSQQFSVNVGGIAAGATQGFTVNVGNLFAGEWHVVGYFNQANGGAWLDNCTWAVIANTANTVTINVHNGGGGATVGGFFFYIVHV